MYKRLAGAACMSAVVAIGTVAFAQSTPPQQPPTSSQAQAQAPQPQKPEAQNVTITGCVQKEADYRAAHNLGSGGAAGTGVGAGNEYVLVNASIGSGTVGTTGSETPGAAGAMAAFELTGEKESEVGAFVGKRVEIIGKMKAAEIGAAGPTGGATAGKPPTGVDVASKDLKLREVEVSSVKETTGTCPAK